MEVLNEFKNGRKIRLNGYHATVLRSSRQMSACKTAVKRKLPNMKSSINVDQPRISNKYTTVIPRTREPVGTQTRQRTREWQRTITLIKRALKAKESQTEWLSSHSVAIQQADERMSHCSQTKITEHHLKHQRWPTKDLELMYQCKTKNTETGKNTICQIKENRQSFNEINKWAQKWNENQTEWVSCHSVAIQQAYDRIHHCSQTKITKHHVKHQRWRTKDLGLMCQCKTKNTGTRKNTICHIRENRQSFNEIIKWAENWEENQAEWLSSHSVAIQQADERI